MKHHKKYIGLNSGQVEASRARYGTNVITQAERESWIKAFLLKFTDPMIVILLIAGVLSMGVSFYEYKTDATPSLSVFFEPIGIYAAILIATSLSFFFEYKASKEFDVLSRINDEENVTVIREDNTTRVARSQIVVGDIVVLDTGAEIPADGSLLEATSLGVDESSLTGEPMAHKTTDPELFDAQATYPSNVVLRGSKVMEGTGLMEVTAVGNATESGKVMVESGVENGDPTPLDEQLARLGKVITWFAYSVAATVIVGRLVLYMMHTTQFEWIGFFNFLLHTTMIAVALLVMAVPEGLPMSVALSLAYSMRRLLKSNNLVRKLNACETMGAATIICTDKTGTLTQNRMQVQAAYINDDESQALPPCTEALARAIAVNSTAELDFTDPENPSPIGNPTEGALLLWMRAAGFDYREIRLNTSTICSVPFSTERKFMVTVAELPSGERMLYVKGAPEILLDMCDRFAPGLRREDVECRLMQYQKHAMRTLGFASMPLASDAPVPISNNRPDAPGLCFDAIVGISDPIREDVADAIKQCCGAGIEVKIVTGDTPATAVEIAREIGLWTPRDGEENIITGNDFAKLTDEELSEQAPRLKIIARARPMDKKRLVEALRARKEVIAVTGDGTNDAPALKSADIGLSMGAGTAVAKQASDITIIDNSFVSIASAVMWGRSLHRNIRRFILFQLTVNVVACMVVMIGSFFGTDSPLTVTQMLWVNLIMDTFAAVALSTLPPSRSVMEAKPRKRTEQMVSGKMWQFIFCYGVWMAAILLYILFVFLNNADHDLTLYERTVFFTIFVMMQFWNMFNTKAFRSHRSPFALRGCTEFAIIALLIFVGQVLIVNFGGSFFTVCPISFRDWVYIVCGTFVLIMLPAEIYRRCVTNK